MDRIERRNLVCNTVGEGLWGLGAGLASQLTVLPLLIKRLGGGEEEVGLLSAVGSAGVLLPQVASAFVFPGGQGRKWFLIIYHLAAIVPSWTLIGVGTLVLSREHQLAARVLLQAAFATFTLTIGIILPVWLDWVAGLFGRETRGRTFGWSNAAVALAGTPAALAAAVLVDRCEFPLSYALLVFLGTACYVASMLVFAAVREVDKGAPPRRLPAGEMFSRFGRSLGDANFRRYLVGRTLVTLGSAPPMFFAVHFRASAGGSVGENTVIALGALQALAQAVSGLGLGRLGDRRGHRAGIVAGAAAQAGSIALALAVPGPAGCAAAFAFSGLSFASAWVSHTNFVFESCPHDSRAAHIAITNLVLAPATVLVPWIAGRAAESLGTPAVFAASLVPTLAGLAWLALVVREVREPAGSIGAGA